LAGKIPRSARDDSAPLGFPSAPPAQIFPKPSPRRHRRLLRSGSVFHDQSRATRDRSDDRRIHRPFGLLDARGPAGRVYRRGGLPGRAAERHGLGRHRGIGGRAGADRGVRPPGARHGRKHRLLPPAAHGSAVPHALIGYAFASASLSAASFSSSGNCDAPTWRRLSRPCSNTIRVGMPRMPRREGVTGLASVSSFSTNASPT
jgi:hypothetical protein